MNIQIRGNKFLANTGWMIGERVFQMAISLVIGMITARYLGPENYGLINYTASFVTMFLAICTLGLEEVIIKQFVDHPEQEGTALWTGIVMRCISSTISILAISVIVFFLNPNDSLTLVVAILQSIALLFRSFELIDYWYQSRLQSKYVTIIKTTAYILISVYKVILLVLKKDVRWFAFSNTLDMIIIAILLVCFYYRSGGSGFRVSVSMGKSLITQSYHFILSGLMTTVYGQTDKILIGELLDNTSVGLYSVAITICGLWNFIPEAIINSARPLIMQEKNKNEEIYIKRLKQLYACIIWLGIAFAVFVTILSKYIVLFLYGKEYLDATTSLIIIVWSASFSLVGSARGIWILSENKSKYVKKYIFWGTVCNLTLNFILIPLIGIEGAAISTLVTQILTCLVAPIFYKETKVHTKYVIDAFLLRGIK